MKHCITWLALSIYGVAALLLGGCLGGGVTGTSHEQSSAAVNRVRERVLAGLAAVNIPTGSVIQVVVEPLEPGVVLTVQGSPHRIPVRGYLAFVDEAPPMDWAHTAQFIVVPVAMNAAPVTIFRGQIIPDIRISEGSGEQVFVNWLKL